MQIAGYASHEDAHVFFFFAWTIFLHSFATAAHFIGSKNAEWAE